MGIESQSSSRYLIQQTGETLLCKLLRYSSGLYKILIFVFEECFVMSNCQLQLRLQGYLQTEQLQNLKPTPLYVINMET
jgi:hypothetical protein